jgi:hypothetical protein
VIGGVRVTCGVEESIPLEPLKFAMDAAISQHPAELGPDRRIPGRAHWSAVAGSMIIAASIGTALTSASRT